MTLNDQWAAVKRWRLRRDQITRHEKPTYDAYPRRVEEPEVKVYVEARDARGRLLREYVYLEGYSLHMLNFKRGAVRDDRRGGKQYVGEWVWDALIEANTRLAVRLDVERERKESHHGSEQ